MRIVVKSALLYYPVLVLALRTELSSQCCKSYVDFFVAHYESNQTSLDPASLLAFGDTRHSHEISDQSHIPLSLELPFFLTCMLSWQVLRQKLRIKMAILKVLARANGVGL